MSLGALARGGMERERRRDSPMPRARRRRRPLGDVRRITAQNRRDPRPPRHVGLAGSHSQSGRIWAISLGAAVRAPASFFGDREPRRRRDSAPTEFPRHGRGRDSSPRNLCVAAAASPRPVSTESPRRSRGVAATRLRRISAPGARRYKLAVLRALVARGRAQRRGGEEQLLDFLFPEQPHRRARPRQRLPNGLFPIVARYYWGRDGLSRPRKLAASTPETYSSDGEETTPRCVG